MVPGGMKEWILLHISYWTEFEHQLLCWQQEARMSNRKWDSSMSLCFLFLQACFLGKATKTILWGSQFFRYINTTYSGLHLHFSYFSSYLLDPQMGWEGDKQRIFHPASILEIPRSVDSSYARIFDETGISFGKWRTHWVEWLWITMLG